MTFPRSIIFKVSMFVSICCCMPALADHHTFSAKIDSQTGSNITSKRLVDEYVKQGNSKKAQELLRRKLGPPCPKCNSAKAVVPIVYDAPRGSRAYLSVRPTYYGEYQDAVRYYACPTSEPPEQWYCLSCHMGFCDQGTGAPIYEH